MIIVELNITLITYLITIEPIILYKKKFLYYFFLCFFLSAFGFFTKINNTKSLSKPVDNQDKEWKNKNKYLLK